MSYNAYSRIGIGERHVTYGKSGTITKGTHEGQTAALVGSGTSSLIKIGAAGDDLRGVIRAISGDDITVQDKGFAEVTYSGAAPVVGWNLLECDGAGGVNVDAINGNLFVVDSVDTVNTKCVVDLG